MRAGRRAHARASTAILIALGMLAAGCSRDAADGGRPEWIGVDSDPVVLVVGVVDLHARAFEGLPRLARALEGSTSWTDVLSGGAGAAAALSLVDGRAPLDHLRAPGRVLERASGSGWDTGLVAVPATLRSEPEWADARLVGVPVRGAREILPALEFPATGPVWRVLLLDPFARETDPLVPRSGEGDSTGLAWLDSDLAAWVEDLRRGPQASRVHVVLTGIPRAPAREQRARALPGGGPLPEAMQVPWVWAPPVGRSLPGTDSESPALVHELVARSLGRDFSPAPHRWSAWWSEHSGGVYLELPDEDGATVTRAWIDERGRWNPVAHQVERDLLGPRTARFDAASLALFFDSPPRLWCAVRGSTDLDFVDLSLVADGIDTLVTGWALEDIDLVRTETPRVRTLALAAETRSDGAVVRLGWPPLAIEVRTRGEMAESSLLGVEVYAGSASRAIGLGSMRVAPFTRAFWRAASGEWPAAADGWWEDAAVGLHVLIDDRADAPAPAMWTD